MDTEQKMEVLGELYEEWSACERCGLCTPTGRRRHNVVFGEGNPGATLVIVGRSPGEHEDITGHPFAGRSGEVIDMFLKSFNSHRDEVFLLTVVGCRSTEEKQSSRNRNPNKEEIAACLPRVSRIIEVIDPYVVLLLGETAFNTLSPTKGGVATIAADNHIPDVRVITPGRFLPIERTAFATWDPSYLLHNWSTHDGGPVHKSFRTWGKAFRVSDMFAELYRGITPPLRESHGR